MYLKCFCWAGLGLYALLSVTDWMLTYALFRAHPEAIESNPIAAACLELHGWSGLALFKAGGVFVFTAAVMLIIRRRPTVAAAVVIFGCTTLIWVNTYSHGLICQANRESDENAENIWPKLKEARASEDGDLGIPERCWFAGEPRPTPIHPAATECNQPTP